MGGRGSGYSKSPPAGGGLSEVDFSLVSTSPRYGDFITGTTDSSVYAAGLASGLSRSETELVHSYTFDLYNPLNEDILAGKQGITAFVTGKLNGVLDKLPNSPGTTYRGISVSNPSEFANGLKKNGSFKFDSFTSTTKDLSTAKEIASGKGSVIFRIKQKRGKDVSNLSSQKSENEILLKAGSKFRYVSHNTDGGTTFIEIKEI